MRLLIIGHGRMGRLVEQLAPEVGITVAAVVTRKSGGMAALPADLTADVAIDFSHAESVPGTVDALAARRINVVIGTTGWQAHEAEVRATAAAAGIGVLAAANFSLGVHLFQLVAEEAARRFEAHQEFGAWLHETHHAAKRDAPSGTALALRAAMEAAGYTRAIDVASSRAGHVPGTHTLGFDGPSETVTLTHTVRDRAVFARGALAAAQWLAGRRGWFTMRDMLTTETTR